MDFNWKDFNYNISAAEADNLRKNADKIMEHKEKQYELTLQMATDLEEEIKVKYCERLRLLFKLLSAKPGTATTPADLPGERASLGRGISRLKVLEVRLKKNVTKVKYFQVLNKQLHERNGDGRPQKGDKGSVEEQMTRVMDWLNGIRKKLNGSVPVWHNMVQVFKEVGDIGGTARSSITAMDIPRFYPALDAA